MANDYNTELVCKTNSQLLQKIDPRDIIKNRNSRFISCKNGVYYFTTRSGTMHENIVVLSMTYPMEVFIARYRDDDIYYDSEIQTIKYKSGKSKCTKIEPDYWYDISHIEKKIGKEPLEQLLKVAWRYIKRIDAMSDTPKTRKRTEQERKNKIKTSVAIIVENDDFKIEATKIGTSFVKFLGYVKEASAPRWQLIEKEKNLVVGKDQQDEKNDNELNDDDYIDLPL